VYRLLTMLCPPIHWSLGRLCQTRAPPTSPHLSIYRWQIGEPVDLVRLTRAMVRRSAIDRYSGEVKSAGRVLA